MHARVIIGAKVIKESLYFEQKNLVLRDMISSTEHPALWAHQLNVQMIYLSKILTVLDYEFSIVESSGWMTPTESKATARWDKLIRAALSDRKCSRHQEEWDFPRIFLGILPISLWPYFSRATRYLHVNDSIRLVTEGWQINNVSRRPPVWMSGW